MFYFSTKRGSGSVSATINENFPFKMKGLQMRIWNEFASFGESKLFRCELAIANQKKTKLRHFRSTRMRVIRLKVRGQRAQASNPYRAIGRATVVSSTATGQ